LRVLLSHGLLGYVSTRPAGPTPRPGPEELATGPGPGAGREAALGEMGAYAADCHGPGQRDRG